MEVSCLFPISYDLYAIERLWSQTTVFSEIETAEGRTMTLERLRKLHADIG